jgi:hypothetical protein
MRKIATLTQTLLRRGQINEENENLGNLFQGCLKKTPVWHHYFYNLCSIPLIISQCDRVCLQNSKFVYQWNLMLHPNFPNIFPELKYLLQIYFSNFPQLFPPFVI